MPRFLTRPALATLGVLALFCLAACAPTAAVSVSATATTAPAPTATLAPTASPTATPAPVLCGNTPLPTPAPSGPSVSGPFIGWAGVPPLPGTLIYSDAARASDGVQTSASAETVGLCTPGVTPDAVTSFYVTRLPANGWATVASVPPLLGAGYPSCAVACWKRDEGGGTTTYFALEHLQAADGATLYALTRLDVHTN